MIVGLALLSFSCDNFLNQEPETKVNNLNFWKDEKDVEAAVYGLHRILRESLGNVTIITYRDRGWAFDYSTSLFKNGLENKLSPNWKSGDARISWQLEYQIIASANLVIDNISRADLPKERHNFYLGQAYCLRAYVYFYILRSWGDAPLITNSEDVGPKKRSSWIDLANLVREDLKKAIELLPPASQLKDANGASIESKQIPSQGTAYAILAHLEAWVSALNNQPELNQAAIQAADQVINSGEYSLAKDPAEVCEKVMLGNSREGIFELNYQNTDLDLKGGSDIATFCEGWPIIPRRTVSYRRSVTISNAKVMEMFPDLNDMRRSEYFFKLDSMAKLSPAVTTRAAYIQKWRHAIAYVGGNDDGQFNSFEDNAILIRLADIILLRAELREKTGDIAGAIDDLNTIRRRAGALEYSNAEGDLKEAIALEREKELFLEGLQLRYFDVIRNGTFREKLQGDFKTLTDQDVVEGALFLPVNSDAFYNNTLMVQTPYWKRNGFAN